DEPTTALDVTIQAQILDLIAELRESSGTAVVLITHDLGVVAGSTDRVAVMYAGRIVETGPTADVFGNARHPYTRGLLASTPRLDTPPGTRLDAIPGLPPDLGHLPSGCPFHPRCQFAIDRCRIEYPTSVTVAPAHDATCWNMEGSS
ncbi:MAG: peptide ABC transporter ATP-binding protein, partial [Planctomycetota bacterium]|nr:peptide ABC transporter ATP-binding protein [Planctomycetota bacterium]